MNRLAILLIRFYQFALSPMLGHGKCRYQPTCSQYALEAFHKHRFFTALALTVWRVLRCNPFSKGGHDPLR
ncbi:MAG: membrane protein insertion efficiency factor YidD [Ndongobacter sp.]|nr:membrane protein insertion efficiency factor YidD [Ndongobacter sp.]